MEKLLVHVLLVFITFHLPKAASEDVEFKGWLNIDCGSTEAGLVDVRTMPWSADVNFTKTGFNKQIPVSQSLEEMNTLRFFPNRTQENCYIVPTTSSRSSISAYIVRAGFLYGNYDGLSKPPTFDMKIDGVNWATVNSSSVDDGVPLYQEIIYVAHGAAIKICLVETREGEVPFISSLETMIIAAPMYTEMVPYELTSNTDPHAIFHLVTRTNFGGSEVRYGGIFDDFYNRIWTSGDTPKNCEIVSSWPTDILTEGNYPPVEVLDDSISTINSSDPIILTVDLDGPHPACFIFYFCSPDDDVGVRATQIYINGQMYSTITIKPATTHVVTIYPVDVVGPSVNVTLAPEPDSTLSTLLSGMEVFTRHNVTDSTRKSAATSQLLTFTYAVLALALSLVALS